MRRWLPFLASFWCAPVIILALHTLLAVYNNDTLEGAAIITVSDQMARCLNSAKHQSAVQYFIIRAFGLLSIKFYPLL